MFYNTQGEILIKENYNNNFLDYKNLLVVVMSCKKKEHTWDKFLNRKDINIIVFYGDETIDKEFILKDKILSLKCNDGYDYLPEKIILMTNAVLNINKFKNISHILKIDDDIIINDDIKLNNIKDVDYGGVSIHKKVKRNYHFNKVNNNSYWNNRPYQGKYTDYCNGGCGYILSRKSMEIISKYKNNLQNIRKNHIYEDLMISLFLEKKSIYPVKIKILINGEPNQCRNNF